MTSTTIEDFWYGILEASVQTPKQLMQENIQNEEEGFNVKNTIAFMKTKEVNTESDKQAIINATEATYVVQN